MTFQSLLTELTTKANERGLAWARSSASLALSAEDRSMLEDIGRSIAQYAVCTPFDPANNPEDWHAADEHEKTVRDIGDAEMAEVRAGHVVRQREDERARLGASGPMPQLPSWMTTGGTALFAMAFAIGIFDWVHERLSDPYVAALVCLIPSIALGVFVCRALTSAESPADRKVGFLAGIGLAIATGILRYAFNPDEWLIALAVTLIETTVVLFLHWHGDGLQARYQAWRTEHAARATSAQVLEAARDQHQRTANRITQLKEQAAVHLREVARRSLLSEKGAEIEVAVVKAIVAGAHQGIAENQGMRRGVSPVFKEVVQ
jgi:hypothetical protein